MAKKRKFVSCFMLAVLLFAMLSLPAFAENEPAETVAPAETTSNETSSEPAVTSTTESAGLGSDSGSSDNANDTSESYTPAELNEIANQQSQESANTTNTVEASDTIVDLDSDTGRGTDISSVNNPLEPNKGSAEIIEYYESGSTDNKINVLAEEIKRTTGGDGLNTTNDVPTIEHVVYKNEQTNEVIEDYYQREDNGATVEIDTSVYPLPKNQKTSTQAANGGVITEITTYTSTNAIQKAIDNVLTNIGSSAHSATIRVDEGIYDGDINIANNYIHQTSFSWENFTLYLLTGDSYTTSTGSELPNKDSISNITGSGIAKITGKLTISGVNVVTAGLFFDTDEAISITDSNTTIYGTTDNDEFTVSADGSKNIEVYTGNGNDEVTLQYQEKLIPSTTTTDKTVKVDLGGGDDILNVNVNLANSADSSTVITTVDARGNDGKDILNIIGTLLLNSTNNNVQLQNSISGIPTIKLENAKSKIIDIKAYDFESYIDSLENKPQTQITEANVQNGKIVINPSSIVFADYFIDASKNYFLDAAKETLLDVDVKATSGTLLASLKIKSTGTLSLGNINASGLNVSLNGVGYVLKSGKTINGANVEISIAENRDKQLEVGDSELFKCGLFSATSYFVAEENSTINSAGSVIIRAKSVALGGFIPIDALNPLVIKVGRSYVELNGTINAGGGNVKVETDLSIEANAKNTLLANLYVPLSANISVAKSYITLSSKGNISASGSVILKAKSYIDIGASSVTGALPISLAISVLSNNTYVKIDGTITATNGDIVLEADADATVQAIASTANIKNTIITVDDYGIPTGESAGASSVQYAMFFSLTATKQKCYVLVDKNAVLTAANGNIIINNNSVLDTNSTARSVASKVANTSEKTTSIEKALYTIEKNIFDIAGKFFGNCFPQSEMQKELTDIKNNVVSKYGYEITADASEHGNVSTVGRAGASEAVNITVNPDQGYTVDYIEMKYLDPVKKVWVSNRLSPLQNGNEGIYYAFSMPSANVCLTVMFRVKTANDPEIKNKSNAEGTTGIAEALKAATATSFKPGSYGNDHRIVGYGSDTIHGYVSANTQNADNGQTIRVLVEPESGYSLKAFSLKAIYYNGNNKLVSETLYADANGAYFFTLSNNVRAASDIMFEAEFEATEAPVQNENRVVGAIALAVNINEASAVIDTNNTITAGQDLAIDSTVISRNYTIADASAIKQNVAVQTESLSGIDETKRLSKAQHHNAFSGYITVGGRADSLKVTVNATAAGQVSFADGGELKFTVTPEQGFKLKTIQLVAKGNNDTNLVYNLVKNSSGDYEISSEDAANINFSEWDNEVQVTAIFEEDSHTIATEGTLPNGVEVTRSARTGDMVYISLDKCDPGNTVNITFKNSSGNEIQIETETVNNRVLFVMPNDNITLKVTAANKANKIVIDANSTQYISAQSYADDNETVKVTVKDELVLSGKDYVIKYVIDGEEKTVDNNQFKVTQNINKKVTLKVEVGGDREIGFDYSNISKGGAIRGPLKVSPGQVVELYVIPSAGYKLTSNGINLYIYTESNSAELTNVKSDADGRYVFTVPVNAYPFNIEVEAAFEQTEEKARQDNVPQFAAGVAVAVSIIKSTNDVAIKNGTINVNGLELTATNGILKDPTISSSTATAGYSQGRLGIAGALEVDVANVKSNAWIAEPVVLTIGTGNLNVEATTYTALTSLAEAAQPTAGRDASQGSGSGVGAGAGIAISVANIVSTAEICDGLKIIQKKDAQNQSTKINSITINADSMAIHTTKATAGSQGWNAGSATLLVLTEGVKSYAMLGSAPAIDKAIFLDVANDINVVSATAGTRTANATGTAAGGAGVVGADMVVSVYKDSAESYHKRSTRSKNLTVSATSNSMAVGVAFAGTFGAPSGGEEEEEGAADAEASRAANIAAILAGKLGTGNMNDAEIADQMGNRQKAQTGEGSFGLAAAFVVICEKNVAIAEIISDLTIEAEQILTVSSSTKTDIYNYAIASAVGCNLGVGAAAAVSSVKYTNHALIGDSKINAGVLYVMASVGKPAYNIPPSSVEDLKNTNVLSAYVYKGFYALINNIFKKVLSDETREKVATTVASILSDAAGDFTKKLVEGTGLENLLATDIQAKITKRLGEIPTTGTAENIVGYLQDFVVNEILGLIANAFKDNEEGQAISPTFLKDTSAYLTNDLKKIGKSIASDIFKGIIDTNKFLDFITNVTGKDLVNRVFTGLKAAGKKMTSKTLDACLDALGVTSDKALESFLYNFMDTEAISGAGSSKIGVAGSLAIGILDGDTIARISAHSGDNTAETITVSGTMSVTADDYQRIITVGSAAADQNGYADMNFSQGESSDVGSNSDADSDAGKTVWKLEEDNMQGQNGTIRFTDKNGSTIDTIKPGSDIYVVLTPDTGYTLDKVYMDGVAADYEFNKVGGNTLILVAPDYTEGKEKVRINVVFRKLNENENKLSKDEAINDYGKGVGIGGTFTLNVVKPTVKAELGSRKVTTGGLQIGVNSISGVDTVATSGTDVLSRTKSLSKNTACDAAVSVCDVDKIVFAGTTGKCDITTNAGNIIPVNPLDTSTDAQKVNVLIYATEDAKTTTKASGIAVGAQSAVGATVAVNVSNSDVNVSVDGTINAQSADTIDPDVMIYTYAQSADRTYATATANGADMDRQFNKIGATKEKIQSIIDKIAKGDFSELRKAQQENEQTPVANSTSYTILDVLSKHKETGAENGTTGAPVSSNVLAILKAQTDAANSDALSEGIKEVKDAADAANEAENSKKVSYQIAAAVAAGISNHKLKTKINGSITCNTIAVSSTNNSNYITRAFASTMTGTEKSNGVAAGVAVNVCKNEAICDVSGNLTARSHTTADDSLGQLTIFSSLTQNIDKNFINALAAQATAGAVAGEDGRFTISGALAILRTQAKSAVYISNNSALNAMGTGLNGSDGGNVVLSAYDKSKIGVRAGGISKSTGAAIGAGASFALLYDNNDAEVIIGSAKGTKNSVGENEYDASGVEISGRNVYIASEKKEITLKTDYSNPFNVKFLVTKGAVQDSEKGILNFTQDATTKEYSVEVNISTDKVLEALNILNFVAYENYYLESICGQINNGQKSDLSLAGAVALMFYHANTRTILGDGIKVNATGDAVVSATDHNTALLIAGSLSVTPAKMGVGVTISSIDDHAVVYTYLGNNAVVNAASYKQTAANINELVSVGIAATIGTGTNVKYNVGGIVNVTNMQNKVYNLVGNNAYIKTSSGNIEIATTNKGGLVLIAIATTGINAKTAAGGTINILVLAPVNKTLIGAGAILESAGAMTISADTHQKVLNIMGAGAPAYKSDLSVAATIGVFITSAETKSLIGDSAILTSNNDMEIRAKSEISAINLDIVVAVAKKTSVGGAIVVDVFKNRVNAETGKNAVLKSNSGSVSILAYAYDWNVLVSEATAATDLTGMSGVICAAIYNSTVMAVVGEGTTITAENSIGVVSVLDSNSYTAAGGITILGSKSNLGVGATVSSVVNTNKAEAIVNNDAQLTAYENGTDGIQIPNRQQRRKGIVIYSGGDSDVVNVAVAAAAGLGKNSASGVVNTLVLKGTYNTYVAKAKLTARNRASSGMSTSSTVNNTSVSGTDGDGSDGDDPDPAVTIEAHLESLVVQVTDDISISRNVGAGGIISTLVFNYNVSAKLDGEAASDGNINVRSYSYEKVVNDSLALAGGKNGGGGNINTLVTSSNVSSAVDGTITGAKNVNVLSDNTSKIYTINHGISGGLSNSGAGVVMVTTFKGTTQSTVKGKVTGVEKNINVKANGNEFITADTVGGSGAKDITGSGAIDVIVSNATVKALVAGELSAGEDINVLATNKFELIGVVEYVSVSTKTAVGGAVLVVVENDTVLAAVEEDASVSGKNISVKAENNKDVLTVSGTVAASGGAGIAATVTVVVSGGKMTQSAHDSIYETGLNPQLSLKTSLESSRYLNDYNPDIDIDLLLAGDEQPDAFKKDLSKLGNEDGSNTQVPGESASDASVGTDEFVRISDNELPSDDKFDTDYTVNPATFGNTIKSTIVARVAKNAKLTAANDITVSAQSKASILVVAGSVAASVLSAEDIPGVGVGVGFAVVVTNTTVDAYAASGSLLKAGNTVTIQALSGVSDKDLTQSQNVSVVANNHLSEKETISEIEKLDTELKINDNKTQNRIRLIGYAAAVGVSKAGAGFNGGIFIVHDQVRAIVAGAVEAVNLNVRAVVDYREALAVSAGASGGDIGANVSLAVVYFGETVECGVSGDAVLNISGTTSVQSDVTNKVQTASGNLAAGNYAGAVGISIGVNKATVYNYIGQGVSGSSKNIVVSHNADTTSKVYIVNASFGQYYAGVSVAVNVNKLKAYSYIGYENGYAADDSKGTVNKLVSTGTVAVVAVSSGNAYNRGISAAGGAAGGNGIVCLAFNIVTNRAYIANKELQLNNVNVEAILTGDVQVYTHTFTGTGAGGGLTIAVGKQKSENRAILDIGNSTINITGSLLIGAGRDGSSADNKKSSSTVTVDMFVLSAGAVSGGLNFAVALNFADNQALLLGSSDAGKLTIGQNLSIRAIGNSRAYTDVVAYTVGGAEIGVSLAYAKLNSVQQAKLDTKGTVEVKGNVVAESIHNANIPTETYSVPYTYVTTENGSRVCTSKTLTVNREKVTQAVFKNGNISGAAVTAGIILAKSNATSNAILSASSLDADGSITVQNTAVAGADSSAETLDVSIASVGILVVHSYSEGTFKSEVISDGDITADNGINVINTYNTQASAVHQPSIASVNVAQIKVNTSYAETKTTATADIKTNAAGNVSSVSGNILVKNFGYEKALAEIQSKDFSLSAASILVGVSKAITNGTQEAYIRGASINADNVSVENYYNVTESTTVTTQSPAKADGSGATAIVGSAATNISGSEIKANVARAKANPTVNTFIETGVMTVRGTVVIHTGAYSYSKADCDKPHGTASAAKIPIFVTKATSSGKYTSYLKATAQAEKAISAGGAISITNYSTSQTESYVMALGGAGSVADVTGVKIAVNSAISKNEDTFISSFTGNGTVKAGSLKVHTKGTSTVLAGTAENTDTTVNLSLLTVEGTDAKAYLDSTYKATTDFNGNAAFDGDVTVLCETNNTAESESGNAKGVALSVISGTGENATAYLTGKTYALMSGTDGKITAGGNLIVKAINVSNGKAEVAHLSEAAILTIQVYLADVRIDDTVEAGVNSGNITVKGKVGVESQNKAVSRAIGVAGNTVAVIAGNGGSAHSNIGEFGGEITKAYVNGNIESDGNITIKARNEADNICKMNGLGVTVSVVGVTASNVKTNSKLQTYVDVGENASLISNNGTIDINAYSYSNGEARIDGSSVGVVLSANSKRAYNYVTETARITFGKNATVKANGNVNIQAGSDVHLLAEVDVNNGGLFAGGSALAGNYLDRTVEIDINSQAKIISKLNNINIKSVAGENDYAYAHVTGSKSALVVVNIKGFRAESTHSSQALINIYDSTEINAPKGDVYIQAIIASKYIFSDAHMDSKGAISTAYADATFDLTGNQKHILKAIVNIAGKSSDERAVINGQKVKITAELGQLGLNAKSYSYAGGVGAGSHATVDVCFALDAHVIIENAKITGSEELYICADGTADAGSKVYLDAMAEAGGAGLHVYSYARFMKDADSNSGGEVKVVIKNNSSISGGNIVIDSKPFSVTKDIRRDWARHGVGGISDEWRDDFQDMKGKTFIEDGTEIVVYDMVGNKEVYIYDNYSGKAAVKTNDENFTVTTEIDETNKRITISNISGNLLQGKLEIHNNSNVNGLKNCKTYYSYYISSITFENTSSYSLVMNKIIPDYSGASDIIVKLVDCVNKEVNFTYKEADISNSAVTFIMTQGTNLTVNDLILLEKGELYVIWTGENGGNLETKAGGITIPNVGMGVAPIWVHSLTVIGANNVGTENNPLMAYLCVGPSGEEPQINISASGNVYLQTSLCDVKLYTDSLPTSVDTTDLKAKLTLQNVVAGGVADIKIDSAKRIYYKADKKNLSIYSVGNTKLTDDWFFGDDKTSAFSRDELAPYYSSEQSNDTYSVYTLPNGNVLYLDNNGKVLRVVGNSGKYFDTSAYEVSTEGIIHVKALDIYIDYTNGRYWLGKDADFILQDLEYVKDENGNYISENLNGTISTSDYLYVYNQNLEEVSLDNKTAYNADGISDVTFKWISDVETGSKGWVAGFNSSNDFVGIFQATNNGSNTLTLISALNPTMETLQIDNQDVTAYMYVLAMGEKNWYAYSGTDYYYQDSANSGSDIYSGIYAENYTQTIKQTTVGSLTVKVAGLSISGKAAVVVANTPKYEGTWSETNKAVVTLKKTSKDTLDNKNYYVIDEFLKFAADGTVIDGTNNYNNTDENESFTVTYNPVTNYLRTRETWKFRDDRYKKSGFEYSNISSGAVYKIYGDQKLRYLSQNVASDLKDTVYYLEGNVWRAAKVVECNGWKCVVGLYDSTKTQFIYTADGIVGEVKYNSQNRIVELVTLDSNNIVRRYCWDDANAPTQVPALNDLPQPSVEEPSFIGTDVKDAGIVVQRVEGSDVSILVTDSNAGIEGSDKESTNIKATGNNGAEGDITIEVAGKNYLGTEENPISLDMPKGELNFSVTDESQLSDIPVNISSSGRVSMKELITSQPINVGGNGLIDIDLSDTPTSDLKVVVKDNGTELKLVNNGNINVSAADKEILVDAIVSEYGKVSIDAGSKGVIKGAQSDGLSYHVSAATGMDIHAEYIGTEDNPLNMKVTAGNGIIQISPNENQVKAYLGETTAEEVKVLASAEIHINDGTGIGKLSSTGNQDVLEVYGEGEGLCGENGGAFQIESDAKNLIVKADKASLSITTSAENGTAIDVKTAEFLKVNDTGRGLKLNVEKQEGTIEVHGKETVTLTGSYDEIDVYDYKRIESSAAVNKISLNANDDDKAERQLILNNNTKEVDLSLTSPVTVSINTQQEDIAFVDNKGADITIKNNSNTILNGSYKTASDNNPNVSITSRNGVGTKDDPFDIDGNCELNIDSQRDIYVNAESDSKLYVKGISTNGNVYIEADYLKADSIKTQKDVYINVRKGSLEPGTSNDIVDCRVFSLSQASSYPGKVYINVDKFIAPDGAETDKYKNIINRRVRYSNLNLCAYVMDEEDTYNNPVDSSAFILCAAFMNDIDISYNDIMEILKNNPNDLSPVFKSSEENAKRYIHEEYSRIKTSIANIENTLGLETYKSSKNQAVTNYEKCEDLSEDVKDNYFEDIFELACIEIVYGNYKEAWELLEICRQMDDSYDEIYLMMALVCLYSNKTESAECYFNDYLRFASDYSKSVEDILERSKDQNKLDEEVADGFGYMTALQVDTADENNVNNDTVSDRLSLIVTCCMYDEQTEMANKYLAIMDELNITFSETLLQLMEALTAMQEYYLGNQELMAI